MNKNSNEKNDKRKSVPEAKSRELVANIERQKLVIPTLYMDESGNTGSNILDDNQTVFTLAACKFDENQAKRLLSELNSKSSKEAHFKVLKRRKAGQDGVIRLLKHSLVNRDTVSVELMHKRYMVVTKVVDLIIEPMLKEENIDLYKDGGNIGLSNLLYMCLPTYCDEMSVEDFYKAFVSMIRQQTQESIERFYQSITCLIESCSNEEFRLGFLVTLLYQTRVSIHKSLAGVDKSALDPSIPSLFCQCITWGTLSPNGFHIVHDDSHAVSQNTELYSRFMDWTQDEIEVGYDRRKFNLPLKAKSLNFGDSIQYPQLQVADIIASAVAYWAASIVSGQTEDYLAKELNKLNLHRFLTPNVLWPTQKVTPKELGTVHDGGLNTADTVAEFLKAAGT
ncbi:DUF3800 domain-containing protein [Vibrio tubiashii]|uniref:DUF3800 domain-containing protein n=1 Tax=Vibrio tubiashii TaxID=29498 RepID=UPI001EFEBC49|nr:DUF3800 domain-containing protein [Vibrio tubiashii]MCG9576512.1 DUF3800 domain-containing protein [Vibrio tubiashii]